jgi:uncharacterized RDD family membrane protein YckC
MSAIMARLPPGMTGRNGSGRLGGRSRRLVAILITVMLLAMVAGLAVGLASRLGHLKHGPVASGTRPSWQA